MHARELIEVAALAALHGQTLVEHPRQVDRSGVERYWSAAKCRFDRWARALKSMSDPAAADRAAAAPFRDAVLEEVLTGETLSRVWAAVLSARDLRHGQSEAGVVAQSVLLGQQEAGNRALSLLLNGAAIDGASAVRLNHLRRRGERWTDLLVGVVAASEDVCRFAPDPDRAAEFAAEMRSNGNQARRLLLASLRASFASGMVPISPNADLNAEIAAAVVGCFDPDMFDSAGLLRSQWMARLYAAPNETQALLAALFDEPHLALHQSDRPPPPEPAAMFHRRGLRR